MKRCARKKDRRVNRGLKTIAEVGVLAPLSLGATKIGEKTRLWQKCLFPLIRKSDSAAMRNIAQMKAGANMMKGLAVEIGRNIAAPLGRRIGTALAAYLLAQGIPQELADQLLLSIAVVGGLTFDVIAAYITNRKRN